MLGNKREALRIATSEHAWSHAFVIASRLGPDHVNDVIAKFAASTLPVGHPLHSLYTVFAGRGPAPPPAQPPLLDAFALASWERTLAAAISNPGKGDRSLVLHLGDSLLSIGFVFAAHICFLCAQEPPRPASDPLCRLALLGANHRHASFDRYPLAVQLTEVLSYAKSLGGARDFIPAFSETKLNYAAWLAEIGQHTQALAYCDSLARDLRSASNDQLADTPVAFAVHLLALGERLRASDMLQALQSPMSDFWIHEV